MLMVLRDFRHACITAANVRTIEGEPDQTFHSHSALQSFTLRF